MNEDFSPLEKRTLLYLGFRHEATKEQHEMITRAVEEVKALARPAFATGFFKIGECPVNLDFPTLRKMFERNASDSVCILISTLGQAVDNRIDRLKDRAPSRMILLDSAANAYIEEVTDEYQSRLELKDQTFRFAPGYAEVPLELQKEIFENVPGAGKTGITLDEGYLMHPFKSMTGIIGFTSKEEAS